MGSYLNPGSKDFQESLNSKIYVDKTLLIERTNELVNTRQKYICLSRPRRFGKSMAADMLAAYYGCGEDTSAMFEDLKIAKAESFKEHLNRYDVIKINMQTFLSRSRSAEEMLHRLQKYVSKELRAKYKDILYLDEDDFLQVMMDVNAATNRPFVILIDEWDCLFREYAHNTDAQKIYLDFLRAWLKDQNYVALAYMTGILPIKKYGTHSALNMFTEYSMADSGSLAEFFGFTEEEVKVLCEKYGMDFDEARSWYDGYELVTHSVNGDTHYSMYSPKSVVEAMLRHKYGPYWNQTETYEALKVYIQMNMDGLKDAVVRMLAGESVEINTGTFTNDMTTLINYWIYKNCTLSPVKCSIQHTIQLIQCQKRSLFVLFIGIVFPETFVFSQQHRDHFFTVVHSEDHARHAPSIGITDIRIEFLQRFDDGIVRFREYMKCGFDIFRLRTCSETAQNQRHGFFPHGQRLIRKNCAVERMDFLPHPFYDCFCIVKIPDL